MAENTGHPKDTRHREIKREACTNYNDSTWSVKRNIVQVHIRRTCYAQRTLDFSSFDIQANCLANVGMENTSRRTGVDDRFKSFERGAFLVGSAMLTGIAA